MKQKILQILGEELVEENKSDEEKGETSEE